jgi:hypothetical protein
MDATVRRVIGEAAKDDHVKGATGKSKPFPFSCFVGGSGGHKDFAGFVPRNVLDRALGKPKPKRKV